MTATFLWLVSIVSYALSLVKPSAWANAFRGIRETESIERMAKEAMDKGISFSAKKTDTSLQISFPGRDEHAEIKPQAAA